MILYLLILLQVLALASTVIALRNPKLMLALREITTSTTTALSEK